MAEELLSEAGAKRVFLRKKALNEDQVVWDMSERITNAKGDTVGWNLSGTANGERFEEDIKQYNC